MTIVVLPDTAFREGLCAGLTSRGVAAVGAPDWFTAIEIARAQPVCAAVFDCGHLPEDGVTWHEAVGSLRATAADPIVVSLRTVPGRAWAVGRAATHPPTHPPRTWQPVTGPAREAATSGTPRPDPMYMDVGDKDVGQVARDVARAIAGGTRRREFTTRFIELYARHLTGEDEAGDEIWRLAQGALPGALHAWALAHGHRESRETIVDVITDTVVKALEPGRYDRSRGAETQAWLLAIARNLLIDLWRRAGSRPRLDPAGLDPRVDDARDRATWAVSFDDPVEREEAILKLRRFLRRKPGMLRFLMLRYVEKAPVAEQAAALGGGHLSPAAQRALVKLEADRFRLQVKRKWRR